MFRKKINAPNISYSSLSFKGAPGLKHVYHVDCRAQVIQEATTNNGISFKSVDRPHCKACSRLVGKKAWEDLNMEGRGGTALERELHNRKSSSGKREWFYSFFLRNKAPAPQPSEDQPEPQPSEPYPVPTEDSDSPMVEESPSGFIGYVGSTRKASSKASVKFLRSKLLVANESAPWLAEAFPPDSTGFEEPQSSPPVKCIVTPIGGDWSFKWPNGGLMHLLIVSQSYISSSTARILARKIEETLIRDCSFLEEREMLDSMLGSLVIGNVISPCTLHAHKGLRSYRIVA